MKISVKFIQRNIGSYYATYARYCQPLERRNATKTNRGEIYGNRMFLLRCVTEVTANPRRLPGAFRPGVC
ncbi:MAG: hypothetical protein LBF51_11390, partial [Zoogloeaceae bacterium]|nr:hypothetical protein [Zoogloeaceae bacterium]